MPFHGRTSSLPSRSLGGAALLVLALSGAAAAQSQSDADHLGAFVALSVTPPGAFGPYLTRSMAGGDGTVSGFHPQLAVQYGHVTLVDGSPSIDAYAVKGIIAAGAASSLHATVGWFHPNCGTDCTSQLIGGLGGDVTVGHFTLGSQAGSPVLTTSLAGDVGYTNAHGLRALGIVGSVPVALVARSGDIRVVPYVAPGYGYGSAKSSGDPSALSSGRFMLGGGVSILGLARSIGISAGFQKIFFSVSDGFGGTIGSKTNFGLSLTIGR